MDSSEHPVPRFGLDPARAAWAGQVRVIARERLRPLATETLTADEAAAREAAGREGAGEQAGGEQAAAAAGALAVSTFAPRPAAVPAGTGGRVNRALLAGLAEAGLIARALPPGGRPSALDLCVLRESLARECTEAETALALQGLGAHPLLTSPAVAGRWLPEIVAGRAVPAFALTEEGAGSDAGALQLAAEHDGPGRRRLTGEKCWISNAPEADVYTVFARTRPGTGARGVTAFAVPADRPGLSGEPLDMISPHPVGRLFLDGVPVTDDDLLGEEGHGFRVAMTTLDLFRPSVGAFAVGMAQAALDAAVAHAGRRTAFGGPLKDLQAVSHPLAEAATRIEAARLLVYAAASAYDHGAEDVTARAAMAKLYATETAQYAVDAAVQIHGARALRRGHLLEHLYREVRAPRIYEGASEVQRTIIARELYR